MKKIIYIVLVTLYTISCKAQIDMINIADIEINNLNLINQDESLLIQNFGQPLSIENELFEMDNIYSDKYVYNGAFFYIINNKIEYFEISNSSYGLTDYNFKVGDNINSLKNTFPLSYCNKKSNHLSININGFDRFIAFTYDSNNIIQKIGMYSY